jgi:hypothetical protein
MPTVLAGLRRPLTREQRRKRCRAARLRDDPHRLPQRALRVANRIVRDERRARDIALRDGKHELPHLARRQRIRRDAARRCVDGLSRLQRARERRRELGLDSDEGGFFPRTMRRCRR